MNYQKQIFKPLYYVLAKCADSEITASNSVPLKEILPICFWYSISCLLLLVHFQYETNFVLCSLFYYVCQDWL